MKQPQKRWDTDETAKLKELLSQKYLPEIAHELGRSHDQVYEKCRREKLPFLRRVKPCNRKKWTETEEILLTQWAGEVPTGEIARRLNRPENSVSHKARAMGLSLATELDGWSLNYLAQLTGINQSSFDYWRKTGKLKTQKLKLSRTSRHFIKKSDFAEFYRNYSPAIQTLKSISKEVIDWLLEGLEEESSPFPSEPKPLNFSPEEDLMLRQWAGTYPCKKIAQKLGRNEKSIRNRAFALKISLKVYK